MLEANEKWPDDTSLRQHDVAKAWAARRLTIGDDLIAAADRQRTAGTKIVLHVDDDQDVGAVDRRAFSMILDLSFACAIQRPIISSFAADGRTPPQDP